MERNEWLAKRNNGGSLGKFYKSRENMVHISAPIIQIPNPGFTPQVEVGPYNLMTLPAVGPGRTYSEGRNAEKRRKRTVSKALTA